MEKQHQLFIKLPMSVYTELCYQAHQRSVNVNRYVADVIVGKVDMGRVEKDRAERKVERLGDGIAIEHRSRTVAVFSPFNEIFNRERKAYGGRWNKAEGCWLFSAVHVDGIRALLKVVFQLEDVKP